MAWITRSGIRKPIRLIAAHYSSADLSGKRVCKQDLVNAFGLPAEAMDAPLIGIVSRFTSQKGADLIAEAADGLVAEGYYMAALGAGEPQYEELFRAIAARHPGRIAVRIGYDNALAHKIEAGADLFLMPSRYEPCGLNQIYSLKYGTVPVVRATGRLDDTIEPGTGFKFWELLRQRAGGRFAGGARGVRRSGRLAGDDAGGYGQGFFLERLGRRSTRGCIRVCLGNAGFESGALRMDLILIGA